MCANASNFQQSELELRDFGCSYKTLHILSWNLTFDNQSFSPCIYIIVFFWTFSVPNKPTKHGRVRRRAGTTADHVMHNIIISRYLPSLNFSMYTAFLKTIKNGSFRITIWYTTLLTPESLRFLLLRKQYLFPFFGNGCFQKRKKVLFLEQQKT